MEEVLSFFFSFFRESLVMKRKNEGNSVAVGGGVRKKLVE